MILKDKVIIITGAGPGMGQAMCRGAAAEGAKVVVSARSVEAINALAADINAAGGNAIAVPCDVSQTDQCHALAKAAVDKWGRIDGMVHSAYYHPDWNHPAPCGRRRFIAGRKKASAGNYHVV